MNISELAEVAIGMVFVYLAVSLACSQLQEVLARMLDWRAKDLEITIRNMLNNPPRAQAGDIVTDWFIRTFWWNTHQAGMSATRFVDALYAHPLIASLIKRNQSAHIGPEQIPARTFSLALFDMVMTAGTDASLIRHQLELLKQLEQLATGLSTDEQKTLQQELERLASAATDLVATSDIEAAVKLRNEYADLAVRYPFIPAARQILQAALPEAGPPLLDQFRRGVIRLAKKYPELDLQRRLEGLLLGVGVEGGKEEDAIAAARLNAERWFDNTMTRATVWYKTNVQKVLLVIGVLVAVALNIDSIAIGNTLWREPTLRQAVADQARVALPSNIPAGELSTIIISTTVSLESLQVPLGWTPCAVPPKGGCLIGAAVPGDAVGWLTKLGGLALTGLAAMQGGPFWFDILGKLVNVGETTKKEQSTKSSQQNEIRASGNRLKSKPAT